jgi:uncharacterized membrane protein YkvA (DUF1232 family)
MNAPESEMVHFPMVIARNEDAVRDGFWLKLKRNLARLPFAEDLVAAFYCAFDPATPLRAKAVLLGALAYFVMPLDVVPDFLLGLGFTDDLTVLLTAYGIVRAHLKPEHREKAKAKIEELRKTG